MIKEKRNLFENWRILAKTKKNRLRADKILVGYKKKENWRTEIFGKRKNDEVKEWEKS